MSIERSHNSEGSKLNIIFCLVIFFLAQTALVSSAQTPDNQSNQINVPLNGARVIQTEHSINKVVTGENNIINVKVNSSQEVIVFGLKEGASTLHVWTEAGMKQYMTVVAPASSQTLGDKLRKILMQDGQTKDGIDFRVFSPNYRDVAEFKEYINQLLKDEGNVLLADSPSGKIFAYGPKGMMNKVEDLLGQLDVPGEQKVYTKRIELENRPVTQLEEKIRSLLTTEDEAAQQEELILDRGKLIVDRETNSFLIVDKVSKINTVEKYLNNIDKPTVSQVRIKARFVELNDDVINELGIDWSVEDGGSGRVQFPPSPTGGDEDIRFPSVSEGGVQFDLIGAPDIATRIRAMERKDLLNLISEPNVVTRNQQEAVLEIQEQTSYVSGCEISSVEGATTVVPTIDTLTDGITLNVTPLIGNNGVVQLDVIPELRIGDLQGGGVIGDCAFDNKVVDVRRAELKVALRDGQTLVIGGLDREEDTKKSDDVPMASDIPILGEFLFSSTQRENAAQNITIFITAEIVDLQPDSAEGETVPLKSREEIINKHSSESKATEKMKIEENLFD